MRITIGDLTLDLTPAQVADLRAQLEVPGGGDYLSADQLAKRLGVSRETVYRRAKELGGLKVGAGPKACWRFPANAAQRTGEASSAPKPPRRVRKRRVGAPLLEVRG